MSETTQAFCFFFESQNRIDLPTLAGPDGMRYTELTGCDELVNQGGTLSRRIDGPATIHLESVGAPARRALLMAVADDVEVTVNGLPSPCLSVVQPGDVLGVDEHVLYLALFNRPYIGPPETSHLASRCGYCRVPIQDEAGMRIYACPSCRLPTHFQGDEIPPDDRLECARLSSQCGHCQVPIVESAGFSHVPSL